MIEVIDTKLSDFQSFLVVDLEATCWEAGSGPPREEMEAIEFGAVLVCMSDLQVIDGRSWFIKPHLHPQIFRLLHETHLDHSEPG